MPTSTRLHAYRLWQDSHPALIEQLRLLYIESLAELATHPIPENTPEQQQAWWQALDHTKERVWLMSTQDRPWDIIGFVKLRQHEDHVSPMFALAKRAHGQGLGEEMIRFYLERVPKNTPLRGEQLVSNGAIRHLNQKAGWIIVTERSGVETLYHPNRRDDYPQRAYDEIVRYHEDTP